MKTVLLNVKDETVKVIDIADDLDAYYKELDCTCIDIVERKIAGQWFDVMCDDEGLLVQDPKISAINDLGQPMLVGNLMFFNHTEDGELEGLSDEQVEHILNNIQHMYTNKFPEGYPMLVQCEYA